MDKLKTLDPILRKVTQTYDMDNYAFCSLQRGMPEGVYSYGEDWANLYRSKNFHLCDPALSSTLFPKLWKTDTKTADSRKQRELFELANDYQINAGYTIPMLYNGEVFYLTFTKSGDSENGINNLEKKSVYLQAFAQSVSHINLIKGANSSEKDKALSNIYDDIREKRSAKIRKERLIKSAVLSTSYACRVLPKDLQIDMNIILDSIYSEFY